MFFVAQRTKGPAHGRLRRINLLFVSCKQHYEREIYANAEVCAGFCVPFSKKGTKESLSVEKE